MEKDVRYLKGVGEQRAKTLAKLGIFSLGDLISHYPRAYEDRTVCLPIALTPNDEYSCFKGLVANIPTLSRIRRGMELVKFRVVDETGSIDVTYFNQSYMRDNIKPGETYIFYGKVSVHGNKRSVSNPDFEPENNAGIKTGCIMPKYRLTSGTSNKQLMVYISAALKQCENEIRDVLPRSVREKHNLSSAAFSLQNIHFPEDFGSLELARRTLIFEELFILACALKRLGSSRRDSGGTVIDGVHIEDFVSALPFEPTSAQMRAIKDCADDMRSGRPMNRLIQGDVGSGKTLVGAAAVWLCCKSGKQCAFMAPTEILAQQHYANLTAMLSPFGFKTGMLIGSMTAKEKALAKKALANGETDILIGTHAILTEDVEFHDLALVITDEQHRFGVKQRSSLSAKGETPHVLIMSATPIPRTLALIIYGDLDISVIDEMPPGRQKTDTFLVDESYRKRLNGFIEKQVLEGKQVFVVCPMVEENEEPDPTLKNATEHARQLQALFPRFKVSLIHGRMKAKDKDAVMADFVAGKTDILVSTTVIEVGVDIPNASLMVIENAERFGLSQLHQLRGRVGRGKHKSYCILVSDSQKDDSVERLKVMCRTNDGFKISEHDLRLRGPGDFFGSRQHGLPEMHIADLCGDMSLLQEAQAAAHELLSRDPLLEDPRNALLKERVDMLFSENGSSLN